MPGPLKHDRDLSKFRDAYGIKDADFGSAVDLAERVRMGVTLDDVSHLVRPITVPFAGYFCEEAGGGAGVYSGFRVTPQTVNGLYIVLITVAANIRIITGGPVLAGPLVVAPIFNPGGLQPACVVEVGTTVTAPTGPRHVALGAQPPYPFFIPAGQQFQGYMEGANALLQATVYIQEIP